MKFKPPALQALSTCNDTAFPPTLTGHYKPYDPYGVYDSNDGYPQHFCELNEDEFGRPYLGPYDRYVHRPSVAPVVPSPQSFCSAAVREEPAPRIAHQVPPMKRRQAEWSWSGVPTPCITSDECNLKGTGVSAC